MKQNQAPETFLILYRLQTIRDNTFHSFKTIGDGRYPLPQG